MKAEKDKKTGKWLIQFRYTDWQGVRISYPPFSYLFQL